MDEPTGTRDQPRVGITVRDARRARGFTLQQAAARAGHTKSWLSKIENGSRTLTRHADITVLARVLEVPEDALAGTGTPRAKAARRPSPSGRTAVYRLYSVDGVLLYVGIARRFGSRWEDHAQGQPWWPLVDHQTVHWSPTRVEALLAEKKAIEDERPVYNIVGSPWRGGILDDGTGFYVIPKSSAPERADTRGARRYPFQLDPELWKAFHDTTLQDPRGRTATVIMRDFVLWYVCGDGDAPVRPEEDRAGVAA